MIGRVMDRKTITAVSHEYEYATNTMARIEQVIVQLSDGRYLIVWQDKNPTSYSNFYMSKDLQKFVGSRILSFETFPEFNEIPDATYGALVKEHNTTINPDNYITGFSIKTEKGILYAVSVLYDNENHDCWTSNIHSSLYQLSTRVDSNLITFESGLEVKESFMAEESHKRIDLSGVKLITPHGILPIIEHMFKNDTDSKAVKDKLDIISIPVTYGNMFDRLYAVTKQYHEDSNYRMAVDAVMAQYGHVGFGWDE
jgi:hypothetical protein